MIKLIKYLKPFILPLLLAVALLYGQAQTDLALPDYMSDIVNTGIQRGGIDTVYPEVVDQSQLDHLKLFLRDEDYDQLVAMYVSSDSLPRETVADQLKKFPKLDQMTWFTLSDPGAGTAHELAVAKAILSAQGIYQIMEDAGDGPVKLGEQELPAGTDLFKMLGMMPEASRQEQAKAADERFAAMGDKLTIQAGASAVKSYYERLGADTEGIQTSYILRLGIVMMGITLLGAIASIAVGFIGAKVAAGLGRNLRTLLYEKVSSFSFLEFDKFSTASLITRSTNDVSQIQNLMVMMIRFLVYAPIIGFGGVVKALDKSSSMSWIIALAVIVLLGIIAVVFSIALPKFKLIQKLIDRLNRVTRENLTGMMVIRAFNTQTFEEDRFEKANRELTDNNLFVNRVMVFLMPMMMLIMNGTTLLIVWVGAKQIEASAMQVGDMMAFMQYAMQIIMAFLMLSMMFIMIPRATVAAGRIDEVLKVEPTITDRENPVPIKDVVGRIAFEDVCFIYPGAEEEVVKHITFTAEPGQTTAIIGATGSGKTTLVNLIPRFYDAMCGRVTLDGIDIKDLSQSELRAQIGYVPQRNVLFSGTIESNLGFGQENPDKDLLLESAEIAQAMEILQEKEDGLSGAVSQGGSNFSGGQKQRLAIARALAKKPQILIFDDSFSALDFKTDSNLRRALKAKTGHSTVILVGQRIASIQHADQILVMDAGSIVGRGTHKQLMASCEVYQEIAMSQLSKEELA